MKKAIIPHLLCFAVLAASILVSSTRAGTLNTNFDAPPGTPVGSAFTDGVLKLTIAEINQKGSFVFEELDPGQRIASFTASFKARIGGGTSRPAHGFSFVLGNDLSLDVPFGEGGGSTSGLVISFDTVDSSRTANDEGNDPGDAPGIIIKLGGAKVAARPLDTLKTDGRFVDVSIQLDADGTIDIVYDGQKVYDNFAFGWTPLAGNFGFGAATSEITAALNANHWIDDLRITTVPVSGAFVSAVTPLSQGASPDSVVQIALEGLASQTVSMTFDGAAVTPTVNRQGSTTTVTYDPPGLLASGSSHTVQLTYEGSRVLKFDFNVISHPTVPASAALTSTEVDTTKSGFNVRVHQVATAQPNSRDRALAQLAGELGPNIADLSLAQADKTFTSATINFEQDGFEAGRVPGGEDLIPGIPGLTPDGEVTNDNIAMEVTGFLELSEGAYRIGINSDDGAYLTLGEDPRDATAIVLVNHAIGSSTGTFAVEKAGLYPFRLLWWEGIGGAHIDLWSLNSEGQAILVNDRATAGHIKAYSSRKTATTLPPFISEASPRPNELNVSTRPTIKAVISEQTAAVASGSIQLTIDNTPVTPSIEQGDKTVTVTFRPAADLTAESDHTVALQFKDASGATINRQWKFKTGQGAVAAGSTVKGYWTFDNGDLKASVGDDLAFYNSSQAGHYIFGTTGQGALADIPHINGQPAKVLGIPFTPDVELERQLGLRMKHGIAPNGGGSMVNQWTLIMDLYWVNEGRGFGTVLRTHDLDQPIDGDMFWRASDGSYGKSCCSLYDNISSEPGKNHADKTWARVVFTVDLAGNPRVLGKYINGFKHRSDITGDGNALDSRFALPPEIVLFQDGDDNEQSSAYISAIQIREGTMSDAEVAALGGPDAAGIPTPRTSPIAGQWDFDNGDLTATLGNDLRLFDQSQAGHYVFGTTGSGALADIPHIDGKPAKILGIPFTPDVELERQLGLRMKHGIAPNGGGSMVNQWTLIMDLYWVNQGRGFGTVLRTHDIEQPIDGDMFWRASDGSYGKSCCSLYDNISSEPGKHHADKTWARVVFAVDLAANPRILGKYVNGFLHRSDITGDGNALDSRFALPPEIVLFQDGDDNEQSGAYINSIQIREGRMSDEQIAALGGPSADGIPQSAGTGEEPGAVQLAITRNGANVTISWPEPATGFILEVAEDIARGPWSAVPGVLSNSATVTVGATAKFYRLRKP